MVRRLAAALLLVGACSVSQVHAAATVREYSQVFTTYPFSDPNPIPVTGRIYPYFRFDGYTDTPEQRSWKVIELENDYLRVLILPEIGGKIWAAIDKTTGEPFIYYNHVVKFRDIAMRGPWTSGGIEPNYGIIGHTPNCATPVDYVTRVESDGSASVTIGVLDLLTRTPWRLEVTLPADAAYFTTRSLWQNTSTLEQPYYTWMNAGLPAAGNLQFVYPGTHYLGHDGSVSPWPMHPQNGKDLSYYDQNDFGPYKSYHVFGKASDFFGAYWHERDAGMARYSTRDDKAGKKIWIWGLAQQGMIWEKLLTDSDGQYVEVQSGRLFNQAASESSATPFKNRGFAPAATDTWTEYWLPIKGTRGFVKANDLGALNVRRDGGRLLLAFSPVQVASGRVEVFDGQVRVASWDVRFTPLSTWTQALPNDIPDARLRVRVLGSRFEYVADPGADVVGRPTQAPASFDWTTVFGLHTRAREWMRQRNYTEAESFVRQALERDPHYVPALADAALLRLRAGDAEAAFAHARHALSIDTYEPAANYYYGVAADQLGRAADARDGFELAAQSAEWRAAAWFHLSRIALRDGRLSSAEQYAARLVEQFPADPQTWQIAALVARVAGDRRAADASIDRLTQLDPLNDVARVERALAPGRDADAAALAAGIRAELPHERLLELAAWYVSAGRDVDASWVLSGAPRQAEALYWRAWLARTSDPSAARALLADAQAASPALVFPFRNESAQVFAWAMTRTEDWVPRYYLALVEAGRGNVDAARSIVRALGDRPTFAPFYAFRASLAGASRDAALADLERARALEPAQWRFDRLLVERHLADGRFGDAVAAAKSAHGRHPESYLLGMLLARSLVLNGDSSGAIAVLDRLHVLPYEGSTDARRLFREAHLRLALSARDAAEARRHLADALQWPEHLGAGKPYDADIDSRVDDWVAARVAARDRAAGDVEVRRARILASPHGPQGAGGLVSALALRDAGKSADASQALGAWAASVDAALAAWGRGAFSGAVGPLPLAPADAGDYGILAAALAR